MGSHASEISKGDIRAFYDRLSPHFRALWGPHLHDGFYRTGRETKEEAQEELVRHLRDAAGIAAGERVLDVGCGMGASAVSLALDPGCAVIGITLSPVQVEMAQELARERGVDARFLVMDAEHIDLDETFDVVWMVGVLGHLPDQAAFVRGSPRLLRAGGRFVLGDWMAADGLSADVRAKHVEPVRRGMLMPAMHTLRETAGWFEDAGYRVIEARDISAETRRTWDEGVSIVKAGAVLGLARELGRDAVGLLQAVWGMRRAMARGHIVYGTIVAERAE
jgi:tocopherol O-methyltransferase